MREIILRPSAAAAPAGSPLDEGLQAVKPINFDVIMLDGALKNLADLDPQQSQIVELRFFGGLSIEDTSEVLGISPATVSREWTSALAWLHREISRGLTA